MRTVKFCFLACVVGLSSLGGSSLGGDTYSYRQYYSGWYSYPQRGYYYRYYYYKPTPSYSGYRHHYVIYYPQRPRHVYYYNPYKRVYWGRCPVEQNGEGKYSLLAEKDRKGRLEAIPESAFPSPGPMPPIPESKDNAKVDAPPDDLPPAESFPE